MRPLFLHICVILLVAACGSPSFAQVAYRGNDTRGGDTAPSRGTPRLEVVEATRAAVAPELDGDVKNDAAWETVSAVSGFWQTRPLEGTAASERTEVRVTYDDENLYVAVIAYDSRPDLVVASDSRRDASLDNTDSFRFILDTYSDGQNGFVFGTNPAGIQYDAQVTREGQVGFGGGRQQAGSGAGFNINWDGVWHVAAATGAEGWSAEFAIPFRTLRFPKGADQTWGINFQRNIGRKNETAYWVRLPRQYNLNRVSLAGSLEGLQVPVIRNFSVVPYALTTASRDALDAEFETTTAFDAGVDLKYGITPSLTLDATINTDFAQVEVDEQQINLDRFQLFFPEKRPFFLENAGLFSVAEDGEVELFFSRRIGVSSGGGEVPILGGARLSGTLSGTQVGLLSMQTRQVASDSVAQNNFSVVRLQRELPNRSAVGFLVTNRSGFGEFARSGGHSDDYNRVFSVDGRLGLGEYAQLSGFVARSVTPDAGSDEFAGYASALYNSEAWRLSAGYTQVGSSFNPEVGFLSRTAYRKLQVSVFHRYRVQGNILGFHELRPHATYRAYWGVDDGFQETGYLHIDNHWEWRSGHEIHTGVNFRREGVREAFEISDGVMVPAATYDHREAQLVAFTNESHWWGVNWRGTFGGFFGGDRASNSFGLDLRVGETFSSEFSISRNDISLPAGDFSTNLFRARLSYSFTPRTYVQALVQYNDLSEAVSANLRFAWLHDANTGLFVVVNQISEVDAVLAGDVETRGITLKYSRYLAF